MALTPFFTGGWNNLSDSFGFRHPFEELWNDTPARSLAKDARAVASARVDWVETPESHVFKVDLPGLKKEEIKVTVEDGRILQISGERSKEEVKNTDTWHSVERSYGQFIRKFRLPENAKVDEVNAKAENGVLTVTVPKEAIQQSSTSRTIDIA